MANQSERNRRVVTFYTNGGRAEAQSGISARVGAIVKRNDDATQRAKASTARKAAPLAKQLITARYSIKGSYVTNRVRVRELRDAIGIDASVLRFPLVLFSGRWGGHGSSGATASIVQAQTRTYTGSFISPGRFRGEAMPLIYSRIRGSKVLQKHGRYKGKVREAIVANRGPSTHDMLTGIERDGDAQPIGNFSDGDLTATLRSSLASYYVSEQRRLRALGTGNG